MIIYLLIGTIWSFWLEYYTTSNIEGRLGQPWIWKERVFHIVVWPYSLGTFVYALYREYRNRK